MRETKRPLTARAGTAIRFLLQQRRRRAAIIAGLRAPDPAAPLRLDGSEKDWTPTGFTVWQGERFRLKAAGHQWIARPLAVVIEPRASLFMRIRGATVRKIIDHDCVYEAWADGEVEVFTKSLSEWADMSGARLKGWRPRQKPGLSVEIAHSDAPADGTGAPDGWAYLWRIGDGRIYTAEGAEIRVSTKGDVGILQKAVDLPLTAETTVSWDWLIEALPSRLPEDLAVTHDYLSLAVEFDNGRDLTYMWSAGLPEGHVFRCPLNWWCDWETHWVLRSGPEGLGEWRTERRTLAADYAEALGGPMPTRIVRVWLIANSVFQRNQGKARFANIVVG